VRRPALVLLVALALASLGAHAIDAGEAFADPTLQGRYERLIHELRCVQCQNVTIADSNVGLAADLRRQIREMIGAGQSDAEIRHFMTERYGDFVLYDPPLRPRTWILWAAPAVLLALAAGIVGRAVLRRSRQPPGADPDDSLADGEKPV
jgi:cytochrome c-type biogenesis protein CcmH